MSFNQQVLKKLNTVNTTISSIDTNISGINSNTYAVSTLAESINQFGDIYDSENTQGVVTSGIVNETGHIWATGSDRYAPISLDTRGYTYTNHRKINDVDVSVGSGINGTGVQRVTIATDDVNISNINSRMDSMYNCIDHVNNHIEVDTNAINGVSTSVGSGVNGTGVQRVTIATDDQLMGTTGGIEGAVVGASYINLADLYTVLGSLYTILSLPQDASFTNSSGSIKDHFRVTGSVRNDSASTTLTTTNQAWCPMSVDSTGVQFINNQKIAGNTISVNSGVNGNGVQRVTIATDDNVSSKLTSIDSTLTNIYNILNAVYSAGAATGQLRVNTIP